jgi:hypothetical protein
MEKLYISDDFKVTDEEIVIHPVISERPGGGYLGEARIIGEIEVNGKRYFFNNVIKVAFKESKE